MRAYAASFALAAILMCLTMGPAYAGKDTDQFEFAEGFFIQQDYRSAAEEFAKLVAGFPTSERVAAASYRIGEAYLRLEQYEQAAAALEKAVQAYPEAKEAPLGAYNLGRARLKLEQPEPALAAFRDASAKDKGKGEVREQALVGAAECLIRLSKLAEAAEVYRDLLRDFPQSAQRADALFSAGWVLAALGRQAEAVESYTTLIRDFPQYPSLSKARLALSDAHTALGQFEQSVAVLNQLEGDASVAQDVLLRRAWNQFKSGHGKEAAQGFLAFADAAPQSPLLVTALHNAGIALFDGKDFRAAADVFARILRLDGLKDDDAERPEARYWLGLSQFNLGEAGEALKTLEPLAGKAELLKLERRDSLLYVYAQALAQAGRAAEAAQGFQTLRQQYPTSTFVPGADYALATAQERLGQLPEAVATLEKMLAEFPTCALQSEARFALAEYLCRLKQPQRALPLLEELAASGNPTDKLLYRLGWVRFDLGQFEPALDPFTRLADLDSAFAAEAAYMAGRAAEQLRAAERAIGFYEKAAAKTPPNEFTEKALFRLGILYSGDQAAANAERYRQLFPQGEHAADLRLKLAESCFAQGDVDTAMKHYSDMLQAGLAEALQASANYGLGWCLLKKERLDEAAASFAKVPTGKLDDPVAADALLQRGEIAYRQQQYEPARAIFEQLKEQPAPRGERALYMLGWCCRRLNDNAAATASFRALVTQFPQSSFAVDAAMRLAEGLVAGGTAAEAGAVLKAALERTPASKEQEEDLLHLYCDALIAAEDWQAALTWNRTLAERFPDSKRAYLVALRLGLASKAVGLLDDAEKYFQETVAKTDTIEAAQAQFNLGAVCFSRQQYLDAAKSFLRVEMVYDYGDLAPKSLYHAVDAFRRGGDTERATLYVQKLKEKYPDSPWTKKAQEP
jgi:TolA-binding protein